MGNKKRKKGKSNAAKVKFRFPNDTQAEDNKRKNISDISFTDSDTSLSSIVQDSNRRKIDPNLSETSVNTSMKSIPEISNDLAAPVLVVTPATPTPVVPGAQSVSQQGAPSTVLPAAQLNSQPHTSQQASDLARAELPSQPAAPPPAQQTGSPPDPVNGPPPTAAQSPAPQQGPAEQSVGDAQSAGSANSVPLTEADRFALAMLTTLKREDVGETLVSFFESSVLKLLDTVREGDKKVIAELKGEIISLRAELNEQKQYSRRNSIRITNPHWREHPYEKTDDLVMELVEKLGLYDFPSWLIDRSHRVGKHKPGRQRDILVKLVGYRPKEAIMTARNNVGNSPLFRGVYVNEDLSRETSLLYFKARSLKKEHKLENATTRDGRVLVSRFKGDPLVVVKSEEELNNIASRGTFANLASREAPSEPINDRLLREAGMPPRKHDPVPAQSQQATHTPSTGRSWQQRPASHGPKNSQQRRRASPSASAGTPRASTTPAAQTGQANVQPGDSVPAPQNTSTPGRDTGQPEGNPGGAAASNGPEWSFETY